MESDDGEITPCLKNGRTAQLGGQPLASCLLAREKTGTDPPPAAPITERAQLTEERRTTQRTEDGKAAGRVRAHVDEVKGKMSSHCDNRWNRWWSKFPEAGADEGGVVTCCWI